MIRRFTLILALILSLLACSAFAQSEAYVPGNTAVQHFIQAFQDGKMIKSDIQIHLEINPAAMGLDTTAASQARIAAKVLPNSTLTLGAGALEDGFRVEIAARYDDGTPICADAALNFNLQGLLIESSFIEGECFSISWETLLRLLDVPEDQIQMIMTPSNIGLDESIDYLMQTAAQLAEAAQPYLQFASQTLAPYGETVVSAISALPVQTKENVPGGDLYPAAAQEISISITAADVGALLTQLADQLENDATLCSLIDLMFSQDPELSQIDARALCASVRQGAAQLTDTAHPLVLLVGLDDFGAPLYVCAKWNGAAGDAYAAEIIYNDTLVPGAGSLMINAGKLTGDASIDSGITFRIDSAGASSDSNVHDFSCALSLRSGGISLLAAEFASAVASEASDGLNTYRGKHMFSVDSSPDDFSMVLSMDSLFGNTAENGEHMLCTGSMDLYAGGVSMPATFANEFTFTPTADGPTAIYTESASMPQQGLISAKETYTLYTVAYDPAETAALTLTQFDTASAEELQALLSRLQASASAFIDQIPNDIRLLISTLQ